MPLDLSVAAGHATRMAVDVGTPLPSIVTPERRFGATMGGEAVGRSFTTVIDRSVVAVRPQLEPVIRSVYVPACVRGGTVTRNSVALADQPIRLLADREALHPDGTFETRR